MNYLIATIKSWNITRAHKLNVNSSRLITHKSHLTLDMLSKFNPRYIFFPHWSWKIPKEIHERYECVIFHETDLPYGRGGSPIQNLIERGIKETKITALRAVEEMDAGPIYMKRDLTLDGSAAEIFNRASTIVFEMMEWIIKTEPKPIPQKGKLTIFQRRTPEQGDISELTETTKVYDYIRMLDAEGYPSAFIETSKLKIDFSKGRYEDGYVTAWARIKVKDE